MSQIIAKVRAAAAWVLDKHYKGAAFVALHSGKAMYLILLLVALLVSA